MTGNKITPIKFDFRVFKTYGKNPINPDAMNKINPNEPVIKIVSPERRRRTKNEMKR